ncbi:hypothetical protein [Nocardia sp. NBC_01377]|uniref:hypothetical protein n=1 Tax=Nocardia sp. NBC_01377 TaxID=2903595 RepID=UPI003864CF39
MSITLAELAAPLRECGSEVLSLAAPMLRYRSLNTTEYVAASMDWCAQVWMSVEDLPGYDGEQVCVGCVDFLTIRLGRELIGDDVLDSHSQDAVEFAPLFEGAWLAGAVAEQFDATTINDVLVVLSVELASPLRGHRLGAWMVSEISDRMLSSHDGLIVLSPAADTPPSDQLAARRLERYWRTAGVAPIAAHPRFLGQASAYTTLEDAREGLAATADLRLQVTAAELPHHNDHHRDHQ